MWLIDKYFIIATELNAEGDNPSIIPVLSKGGFNEICRNRM